MQITMSKMTVEKLKTHQKKASKVINLFVHRMSRKVLSWKANEHLSK